MRRLVVLAVLCLAAVAACADDDDGVVGSGDTAAATGATGGASTGAVDPGAGSSTATGGPAAPGTTSAGAQPGATNAPAETAATGAPAPTVAPAPVGEVAVALQEVAQLDSPVAMAVDPTSDAVFVAEQGGALRVLRGGQLQDDPVVDLTGQVSTGNEQGLLGVAISPDGAFLYLDYTDRAGDTHVVEHPLDAQRAAGAAREVLVIDQPFSNHNGGQLAFDPAGNLYIGMGDGGSQGDPSGNGQRLDVLLAKILRISPRPSGDQPYGIPADNPFVGRGDARPEIWAYGLRNPWRFSFDSANQELWIADVGGSVAEEIDWAPAGAGGRNYGWVLAEGTHVRAGLPPDAVEPIVDIPHASEDVCSVIGGFVYRGTAIPGLAGTYLYGDFCRPEILGLRAEGGTISDGPTPVGLDVAQLTSFGQGNDGELWVLSRGGAVSRLVAA